MVLHAGTGEGSARTPRQAAAPRKHGGTLVNLTAILTAPEGSEEPGIYVRYFYAGDVFDVAGPFHDREEAELAMHRGLSIGGAQ